MSANHSTFRGADLTGRTFGRLTVMFFDRRDPRRRVNFWKCSCKCGKTVVVRVDQLRSGKASSCGCFREERRLVKVTTHGHCKRGVKCPEYKVWSAMIQRCHNPKIASYPNYGGRGITVCDRWRDSFENFFADMGSRPKGMTLDRTDNDGGYESRNCRWASLSQQRRNTRIAVMVVVGGEKMSVHDLAEKYHVPGYRLRWQIKHWGIETALARFGGD